MKLVEPTDFEVLAFIDEHGRNNAVNVAASLGRDRSYINTRLRHLEDHGLLRHVGPAEHSGLYEITERGEAAVAERDAYGEADVDFEARVEARLAGE